MEVMSAAPVLSTPEDIVVEPPAAVTTSTLSPTELASTYEIVRTASELFAGRWRRIALQFPDHMLVDAPQVVEALQNELSSLEASASKQAEGDGESEGEPEKMAAADISERPRIYILADTSYSACCVDEIAAEHVSADVVVHYGRTCLSPTARLPVILIYTHHRLDHDAAIQLFESEFLEKDAKVVIMADLTYQSHVEDLVTRIRERGYTAVHATDVVRDPGASIPNRRISPDIDESELNSHALFHISNPPTALLLTLSTRFSSLHVLETQSASSKRSPTSPTVSNPTVQTRGLLRRRFARLLALSSASTVGVLINTLSLRDSLGKIETLRHKIAAAGKKSYTVVVGKLNPAKLANFAEVDGWVVVGCWESGLVEDGDASGAYWKPVVTPFELEVALLPVEERVWGGEWWGGLERLKLDDGHGKGPNADENSSAAHGSGQDEQTEVPDDADFSEDESAPPEFDLLTGKLISTSRPMRSSRASKPKVSLAASSVPNQSLVAKDKRGEVATINGVVSPGAEFLRSKRTWQGLGSDFAALDAEEGHEESTVVEEGRSGVARGYVVGESEKH